MDIKKTAIEMLASARDTMPEIPGLSTGYSYVTAFGGRAAGTIVSGIWPSAISADDTTAMKSTEAADDMDSVADAESSKDRTMDIKKTAIEMFATARDTIPEIPGLSTGYSYVTAFGGRAAGTIVSGIWPSAISAAYTTAMKSTEAADDMDSVADAESSEQTCNFKVNGTAVAVAAGAGVAAIAAPLIISGMGFTAGGIAANSCGAYIMSLYGGAVPAGGLVAALQSAGVLGVSTTTIFGVAAAGGGAGYGIKKQLEDQGKED